MASGSASTHVQSGTSPEWLEPLPDRSLSYAQSPHPATRRGRPPVPLPTHLSRVSGCDRHLNTSSSSASTPRSYDSSYHTPLGQPIPSSPSPNPARNVSGIDSPLYPTPYTVPIPIPIPIDGPSRASATIGNNTHGPAGVFSPPTPVPSPRAERSIPVPINIHDSESEIGGNNETRRRTLSGMDHRMDSEVSRVVGGLSVEENAKAELGEKMGRMWADQERMADSVTNPQDLITAFQHLSVVDRFGFLTRLIPELKMNEALNVARAIEPLLRRDMLKELPIELALHCLSFIDDATTLVRASRVSRHWNNLLHDEQTWKEMCRKHRFQPILSPINQKRTNRSPSTPVQNRMVGFRDKSATFREQYKKAFMTQTNWLHGGRVLKDHVSANESVVTAIAVNAQYLIVGMATPTLHVFDSQSGGYLFSLDGHTQGVWVINIVTPLTKDERPRSRTESKGAKFKHFSDMRGSDPLGEVRGWGSRRTIAVSGGGDRVLKVWDMSNGQCIYNLTGHTSTIRCLQIMNGLPYAVTGSRDKTLRVWDLQKGEQKFVLRGHTDSVRCLDIAGNLCVSGSYDGTARVWDILTGRLIHTLIGHFHHIYSCIFQWDSPAGQPARIITGSLDASVRVWDAVTGSCLALLQGHTALVGSMQINGNYLVTGGSDGRVILYDLTSYECLHRICAHDNSITAISFDERYIISTSNDGRIKLWDTRTGEYIRELSKPCDGVWKVGVRDDRVYIMLSRGGKVVLEFLTFRPEEVGS